MRRFAIAIITSLCLCIMFTPACSDNKILVKPEDTTLEFWIAEKVPKEDFKDHYSIDGVFGGYIFLGKDYHPIEIPEDNFRTQPEHCVANTVTAYPDYSSNNGKFDTVTRIEITDPVNCIYGITCNSTLDDFVIVFNALGCQIQVNGITHTASYGKSHISFTDYEGYETVSIWVEVTNKHGIIF